MDINEITTGLLSSVAHLIALQEEISESDIFGTRKSLAFRGQSREFEKLTPSFQRQFKEPWIGAAELIELELIRAFRTHYEMLPDRSSDMPDSHTIRLGQDLRCLSVMQHYEIPTRLLDWSSDFWTSVYFACAADAEHNAEFWIYDRSIFEFQRIPTDGYQTLLDPQPQGIDEPPILGTRHPESIDGIPVRKNTRIFELDPKLTPRMRKQSAHHTVSDEVFSDHAPLLFALAKDAAKSGKLVQKLRRVKIAAAMKGNALQFLAQHKGITASSIFPDVVGLGRFLRWQFDSLRTMLL